MVKEVKVEIISYGNDENDPIEQITSRSREFSNRDSFYDAMDEIKLELAPQPSKIETPRAKAQQKFGVVNEIMLLAPRWHSKDVLVADWKIGNANKIEIISRDKYGLRQFPEPFYIDGETLRTFPLEKLHHGKFRAVPLDALKETA